MSPVEDSFWSTLPLGRDVRLVGHDRNGLAAFSKPAGVLSHPNESQDGPRSLLTVRYDTEGEFYRWVQHARTAEGAVSQQAPSTERRLYLLNRLDSATSGLLLATPSEALAREIRALFQRRQIKKVYNALVFGAPQAVEQLWRDRLAVQKRAGQIRTAAAGNIPAEAHMRVLRLGRGTPSVSLIQLEPKTGRSHQLRVQCAKRHLPIVGDATYGDFKANREFAKAHGTKRMFLHSLLTEFEYTFAGRTHHFAATAPLPEEFAQAF